MSLEWRIALRNLFRNKRRNLIAGGAVAFSCAGLILLGSYLVRTEHYLQVNSVYINHVGHFSIYKNGGLERHLTRPKRYSLSLEDQNRLLEILKTFPEVEFVGKYLMGVGLASNGCQSAPFLASGVEPGTEARIRAHPEVREWTPELAKTQRGRPISSESEISLTDSLARRLGKEMVADEAAGSAPTGVLNCEDAKTRKENSRYADLQLMSRSFAGDFAAVDASIVSHHSTGLFFSEDTGLVLPLSLLQKLYDTDRVTYLGVFLKDPGQAKVFFPRLNQALQTSGLDLLLLPYWDERVSLFYVGVMSFLFTMATFFYILVLGMIAVTITNFVTLGILERRREIGTLRAIGFLPDKISGLLLRETLLLTAIGAIAGLLFSFVVIRMVNNAGIRFRPPGIAGTMPFILVSNATLCTISLTLIAVMTLVSAHWTLKRKSKEPIVTLLTS